MCFNSEVTQIAEQSVIGAIIIEEKSLSLVIDIIKAEDFYFPEFKETYKAILELSSEGKSIDFISVLKKLIAQKNYDESQTKKLLLNCAELVPSISQIKNYAQTVIDSSKARKLQRIGTRLAFDSIYAENANEVADEAMGEIYELLLERHKKQLQSIDNIGYQVLESYKSTDKDLENRSYTGFPKLDEILK